MKINTENKNKVSPSGNSELPPRVKKYLDKYSPVLRKLEFARNSPVNCAVVIPAISEYDNIIKLLTSLSETDNRFFHNSLFIFVINNPEDAGTDIKNNNESSLRLLRNIINENIEDKFIDKIVSSGLRIAVVDASSEGNAIPGSTAGVGHARKIGMDLALTIFDYSSPGKKILVCLDADCTVEKNYLTEIVNNFNERKLSAAVIGYSHSVPSELEIEKAIVCYEIFLNYYELGLKYAGSPYSFHTIGSTIACDFESYIKAEGMNKNKAGEDFYFLEKLIKNNGVAKINSTSVHPAARTSWRVPFGTGQRIERFLNHSHDEYLLYNPSTFSILKSWLNVFLYGENLSAEGYLKSAGQIDAGLYNFLASQNFVKNWEKISLNSRGIDQLKRQKIIWFDGFRTLKLIHYLRDNGYPLRDMFDALDNLFVELELNPPSRNEKIPDIAKQKEYLALLKHSIEKLN